VDRHLPVRVEELAIDAAVNLVHDLRLAEEVAALCRLLELPVTGPSRQAHLCADRALLKDWLGIHNLATPAAYLPRNPVENLAQEHRNFGFPVWVRPRQGTAAPVSAGSLEELQARVLACRCDFGEVQIERKIAGTVVCTALWRKKALGSAEVCVTETGDLESVRIHNEEIHIPARIPATGLKTMERLAERVTELLSVDQGMLVTMVRSERQELVILDVDPLPSLHRQGLFCRVAAAYGLGQGACARQLVADLRPERPSRLATRSAWMCG
jgi:D-alanine-D-alanine ligase-like ATP-grasp enzyme